MTLISFCLPDDHHKQYTEACMCSELEAKGASRRLVDKKQVSVPSAPSQLQLVCVFYCQRQAPASPLPRLHRRYVDTRYNGQVFIIHGQNAALLQPLQPQPTIAY